MKRFAIAKAAIQAGKQVYCEKPLTHTVAEARQIAAAARESKVVTQTGNQGSGSSNFRRSIEWDGPAMSAKGAPEAAAMVKPQHRGEWGL